MRTRAGVLIGREVELAGAVAGVRGSVRGGSAPACFVTGEPGVGKSRLLAEVSERAGADVLVVRGRASVTGPVSPLRPFAEALASIQRRGLLPDDHLGGYRAVLGRVLPQLADPDEAGLPAPPILAFAEAVLRVLSRLGGVHGGCLLVLEDLHDADPESLAVLEYLLDNIAGAPVAVLGGLRDEPGAARDVLLAAEQRGTAQVQPIRSLDHQATGALIAACLRCDRPSTPLVDLIWRNSRGNPLMVEELLYDLIDKGQLDERGGDVRAGAVLAPPPSMLQLVGLRLDRMQPAVRRVLVAAAVYGEHFPVATAATAAGLTASRVWDAMQVGIVEQLIVAEAPGWYRFHHPLTHAAVLELAGHAERRQLAASLAEAVLAEDPAQVAATCRLAARLMTEAGNSAAAARLYTTSGRAALYDGAIEWAVADLGEAHRLAPARQDLTGDLVAALTRAGQLDRALELVDQLGPASTDQADGTRVRAHLALTLACHQSGRPDQAAVQLARARQLAAVADDELARLHCDAVAAGLTFGPTGAADPAVEQATRALAETAERLARTATDAASRQQAAEVACRAWSVVTRTLWSRQSISEVDACRQRIGALASQYALPGWAFTMRSAEATIRLSNDGDALPMRLLREDARRLGAVDLAAELDGNLLLHEVLVGEGSLAPVMASLTEQVEQARRTGDLARRSAAVGALLLAAALRADRPALTELLARHQAVISTDAFHLADSLEVAQAICLLLEGRDDEALTVLEGYERRNEMGAYPISFARGPVALLGTLAGSTSPGQVAQSLDAAGRGRWTRQFLHWAAAVHAGRAGDVTLAGSHVQQAAVAAEIYPVPRHLAARLTARAAAADGWGSPVEDLRAAEVWFHDNDIPVAARSCRDVLRALGASVRYRSADTDAVPAGLRAAGVTAREYEICLLLSERLGNREIGERLHISPRTVEKHVAALLAKLTVPDRRALVARIAAVG